MKSENSMIYLSREKKSILSSTYIPKQNEWKISNNKQLKQKTNKETSKIKLNGELKVII